MVPGPGLEAQLVRVLPHAPKGCGLDPRSGTCLGCRFDPLPIRAHTGGNQSMFLSHINVCLILPTSLSKINKYILR